MTTAGHVANRKHRNFLPVLFLFLLTNIIFCIVYFRFISGSAVYMYADIGNDSLSSSYPLLSLLSRSFHDGSLASYALTDGLGTDVTSTFLQYINPIKLMMLVFPTDMLPQAIMLATFIQVNLLSLFGWIFFSAFLKNKGLSPVVPALAWTFTGYVVLWGQNYSFLTTILLFTMVMALVQLCLNDSKKTRTLWLIPVVALFLISNYYFLYMTAAFAAVYLVFWGIFTKPGVRVFFKKLGSIVGMVVLGCLMAAVSLLPIISNFLSSNRVERLDGTSVSFVYDAKYLLTFLGRLFSVNTFGPGSGYTAAVNYYEAALLSVSCLFLFGLIYLIFKKKYTLRVLALLILSVLLLALPKVSSLLNMNPRIQRWSFMLCFAECLVIALFARDLFEEKDKKALTFSLILTPILTGAGLGLLLLGKKAGYYSLSPKAILLFGLCFVFFEAVLLFFRIAYDKKAHHMKLSIRTLSYALLGILTVELAVNAYPTVNDRTYLKKESFYSGYYNDGSQETIAEIQAEDPDLYRMENDRQTDPALYGVTATADKMFANEGMVNDYNGLSVYTSTLSSSLASYGSAYLTEQGKSNFFIIDFNDYYLFTLLGGRYVIGASNDSFTSQAETSLYSKRTAANGQTILTNKNALPFGYIYKNEVTKEDFSSLTGLERMRTSTKAYYLTDGSETGASVEASADLLAANTPEEMAVSDLITMVNDCEITSDGSLITLTPTGADPFISLDLPDYDTDKALCLSLSTSEESSVSLQIFMATADSPNYSAETCKDYTLTSDSGELMMVLPENLTNLRIDTTPGQTVTFDIASLFVIDPSADFADLAASDVKNITWESQGIQASWSADVTAEEGNMLCLPLSYSANWTAEIDGEKTSVKNINGGLMGVYLKEGTHQVTLTYTVPHFTLCLILSLIGCAVFLLLLLLAWRKERHLKK